MDDIDFILKDGSILKITIHDDRELFDDCRDIEKRKYVKNEPVYKHARSLDMTKRIMKLSEVKMVTGLSGSSIYRGADNGTFPKPIKLGERSSGWIESEVYDWIDKKIKESRGG